MVDRSPIARLVFSVGLVVGGAACGGSSNGEPCSTDLDCQTSLLCVADPLLAGARCMRPCEDGIRLCSDGLLCLDLAGGRACYPGGPIAFEEPCSRSLECEAGTVCPDSVRTCVQACAADVNTCLPTERCHADDAVGPYCSP